MFLFSLSIIMTLLTCTPSFCTDRQNLQALTTSSPKRLQLADPTHMNPRALIRLPLQDLERKDPNQLEFISNKLDTYRKSSVLCGISHDNVYLGLHYACRGVAAVSASVSLFCLFAGAACVRDLSLREASVGLAYISAGFMNMALFLTLAERIINRPVYLQHKHVRNILKSKAAAAHNN